MSRVFAALLCVAGCADRPIAVKLRTSHGPGKVEANAAPVDPDAVPILDDAFGWWGVPYVLTDRAATITIIMVRIDDGPRQSGGEWKAAPCRHVLWVDYDADLLTHELGHTWGLEHLDAQGNVMHHDADMLGHEITEEQDRKADKAITRLRACPRGTP